MHENFLALNKDKRNRIINAAMEEFTTKGFRRASTNEIVKKAEISKSLLFYYFSSKEELFQFLCKYRNDFIRGMIEPQIINMPSDVFERWRVLSVLKFDVAVQHPDMSNFTQAAFRDDGIWIQDFLKQGIDLYWTEFITKFHEGIDTSKFKPDIDVPQALQIILWTLEGFGISKLKEPYNSDTLNDYKFRETVLGELDNCLNTLKKLFYKEEFVK